MRLILLGCYRNSLDIAMHWLTPSLAPVSRTREGLGQRVLGNADSSKDLQKN